MISGSVNRTRAVRAPVDVWLLTGFLGSGKTTLLRRLATRGVANKVIALELGISQSTVSRLIARALVALRLADVREAMSLARTEPSPREGDPSTWTWTIAHASGCDWGNLTAAERDIVGRVLRRESRAQIAAARGTSLFTVNSQLATIFAKLRINSKLLQLAATRGVDRV